MEEGIAEERDSFSRHLDQPCQTTSGVKGVVRNTLCNVIKSTVVLAFRVSLLNCGREEPLQRGWGVQRSRQHRRTKQPYNVFVRIQTRVFVQRHCTEHGTGITYEVRRTYERSYEYQEHPDRLSTSLGFSGYHGISGALLMQSLYLIKCTCICTQHRCMHSVLFDLSTAHIVARCNTLYTYIVLFLVYLT